MDKGKGRVTAKNVRDWGGKKGFYSPDGLCRLNRLNVFVDFQREAEIHEVRNEKQNAIVVVASLSPSFGFVGTQQVAFMARLISLAHGCSGSRFGCRLQLLRNRWLKAESTQIRSHQNDTLFPGLHLSHSRRMLVNR